MASTPASAMATSSMLGSQRHAEGQDKAEAELLLAKQQASKSEEEHKLQIQELSDEINRLKEQAEKDKLRIAELENELFVLKKLLEKAKEDQLALEEEIAAKGEAIASLESQVKKLETAQHIAEKE